MITLEAAGNILQDAFSRHVPIVAETVRFSIF